MTTAYYHIIDELKTFLTNDRLVTTVTSGSLDDVDVKKQTIFPLCHIIVNNARIGMQTIDFNISIIAMDVVDITSNANDNEDDVLNTQLAVLNRLAQAMMRGGLFEDYIQVVGETNCEPFTERFENYLAGWTMTFDLSIPNEMTIC